MNKRWFIISVLLVCLALITMPAEAQNILYVKPSISGAGNCSTWANACTLQTALTNAGTGDEIWVAAGTDKPTTLADRTATFSLKNGVKVYGGRGVHQFPTLGLAHFQLPCTERMYERVVKLSMHTELTDLQVEYIAEVIRRSFWCLTRRCQPLSVPPTPPARRSNVRGLSSEPICLNDQLV